MQKIPYRADIDGLRGLAVLLVIIHHANPEGLSGGFIGVDVFFVISGYLITSIIRKEEELRQFSLVYFYCRRVLRLIPALVVVALATIALASFLMVDHDFKTMVESLAATMTFTSNFYFYANTQGYFADPTKEMPFLHTWSLAVEEQFYLFYPLILLFLIKGRVLVLAVIMALSFIVSELGASNSFHFAFYLTPSRIWELGAGALLTWLPHTYPVRWINRVMEYSGFALIVGAAIYLTPQSAFPGVNALFPVVGAMLIIASQGPRFLAWRPLVYVGKISYSLYLWHWPLLALGTYYMFRPLTSTEAFILVCVAGIFAALSTRYIELPIRRLKAPPKRVITIGITASFAVVMLGFIVAEIGVTSKQESLVIQNAKRVLLERPVEECDASLFASELDKRCIFGKGKNKAILFGDSHAGHLGAIFDQLPWKTRMYWVDRCPPLFGATPTNGTGKFFSRCSNQNDAVLDAILNDPSIGVVFLSARWNWWLTTYPAVKEQEHQLFLIEKEGEALDETRNAVIFKHALKRTVRRLRDAGKEVVLIMPTPEFGCRPDRSLILRRYHRRCTLSKEDYNARREGFIAIAGQLEGVELLDFTPQLCGGNHCAILHEDLPIYRDDDHFSRIGAQFLAPPIEAFIRNKPQLERRLLE